MTQVFKHPRQMSNDELARAIRSYKIVMNDWRNAPDVLAHAREHLRDLINERTRRELHRMGWLAYALIAGIFFFLGGAVAFLLH